MKNLKKVLFSVLAMLIATTFSEKVIGQNLVPNPSFEDIVNCPYQFNQVSYAAGWFITSNSPDYFNTCASGPDISIPYNWFGYHYPSSGNAYAGFLAKDLNIIYRECLGASLFTPLLSRVCTS